VPVTGAEIAADFVPEVLAREGGVWVSVKSSSMAPLVHEGDALRLVSFVPERVREGALVAFRRDGVLVVHRVLADGPGGLVTKGDALLDADAPVQWAAVVARVAAIRTRGGRVLDLERRPWPVVGRMLAAFARRRAAGRVAWLALRAPFHLAAFLGR
jgi:signal peptidase I